MTAISGIATFDGSTVEPAALDAMWAAAAHRGIQGARRWTGQGALLGHQSETLPGEGTLAAQPVCHGDFVLVADARLDNRAELTQALRRSRELPVGGPDPSDAQLLLAAFRRWGDGCAEHLVGDFAFAVWDHGRRQLFAARDPMGMRSLVYRVEAGRRVLFATEVKQLLAAPAVPTRLSERAVAADLAAHFGRPDWTFFEGIDQLAPGHVLVCSADGHRTRRFWDIDPDHAVRHHDRAGYVEHLRSSLAEAVAARLRTDRPVGFLLSGGMDSGSVASLAGWLRERGAVPANDLIAAQWAFKQLTQCDERAVSRQITRRYGIEDLDVVGDAAGPLACFPEHLPDGDDPMLGAFQPLIEHGLQALADRGAGVVLGGDRGDLVLGDTGYSYLRMAQARQWAALGAELRLHRSVLDDRALVMLHRHLLAPLAGRLQRRAARRWAAWRDGGTGRHREPTLPGWIDRGLAGRTDLAGLLAAPQHTPDGLGHAAGERYRLIFTQLHVRGSAWSERTYARHGLRFVDPFSDQRMVALLLAMPQQQINRPGDYSKPLLREAMAGIMPEGPRSQARKVLPTPLFDAAMRSDAAPLIRQLLLESRLAEHGFVDPRALLGHFDRWLAGGNLAAAFWWAIGLEIWVRRYAT